MVNHMSTQQNQRDVIYIFMYMFLKKYKEHKTHVPDHEFKIKILKVHIYICNIDSKYTHMTLVYIYYYY